MVALGLLVITGVAVSRPAFRDRLEAYWIARSLDSPDPMKRADTRQRLLDLGRPAIDVVYPRLIAGEIADEITGQESWAVLAGKRIRTVGGSEPDACDFVRDDGPPLAANSNGETSLLGATQHLVGPIVCPTAKRLERVGAARELVVVAGRMVVGSFDKAGYVRELRVAVPLDDDLAPEILDAVRARLTALSP